MENTETIQNMRRKMFKRTNGDDTVTVWKIKDFETNGETFAYLLGKKEVDTKKYGLLTYYYFIGADDNLKETVPFKVCSSGQLAYNLDKVLENGPGQLVSMTYLGKSEIETEIDGRLQTVDANQWDVLVAEKTTLVKMSDLI